MAYRGAVFGGFSIDYFFILTNGKKILQEIGKIQFRGGSLVVAHLHTGT
jgi:hypothetical protein